ncbi:NUDIX domain-containing protein [Candidatus Saccharibacteria bacterium]|nr:NUDIX domain-containing protein [Candidatus Saccharibacteria bacterium]
MPKQSAGILLYRRVGQEVEVLLVHPGGPFWARKDAGVWSMPKGEYSDEDGLEAAKREFREELGVDTTYANYQALGEAKLKSGKIISAWAVEGDLDVSKIKSNTFEMEWPPRSGSRQEFPEIDKAEWFDLPTAKDKLNPAQVVFLEELAKQLELDIPKAPQQDSLF